MRGFGRLSTMKKLFGGCRFCPVSECILARAQKLVLFRRKSANDIAAPKTLLPKGLNIIRSQDRNNMSKNLIFHIFERNISIYNINSKIINIYLKK